MLDAAEHREGRASTETKVIIYACPFRIVLFFNPVEPPRFHFRGIRGLTVR